MKCRWLVWRGYGYGDTPCEREAGHGTDGAFCKQHAKMAGNPAVESPTDRAPPLPPQDEARGLQERPGASAPGTSDSVETFAQALARQRARHEADLRRAGWLPDLDDPAAWK